MNKIILLLTIVLLASCQTKTTPEKKEFTVKKGNQHCTLVIAE